MEPQHLMDMEQLQLLSAKQFMKMFVKLLMTRSVIL